MPRAVLRPRFNDQVTRMQVLVRYRQDAEVAQNGEGYSWSGSLMCGGERREVPPGALEQVLDQLVRLAVARAVAEVNRDFPAWRARVSDGGHWYAARSAPRPTWSPGDRLDMTLDAPSEAGLRLALAAAVERDAHEVAMASA